jgi:cell wall-associated NlpC family hydrolase
MRSAAIGLAAILLMVMIAIAAATGVLTILPGGAGALAPTAQALQGIPPAYLARYQQAAQRCPGLPWTVLAAIGEVESDHGRSTAPGVDNGANSAGAAGPMQMGVGTGQAGDAFWRFAVDGDADGIASPYDPADAIPTAAAYLCQALADHHGDLAGAVFAYNHAESYVERVLTLAGSYGATVEAPTPAAEQALAFALAQLGTPYRWGGDGLEGGGFDCSGLVHAAYQAAGIPLPRTAQAQYDAGPHLPADTPLVPGDLVFFGAGPANVTHVGMVVSPGRMVDAPHTGALVRVEPYMRRRTYLGATRPAGPQGTGPPSAQVRGGIPLTMLTPIAHAVSNPASAIRAVFMPITLFLERSLDVRLLSLTTRWTNRKTTSPRAIRTRAPT